MKQEEEYNDDVNDEIKELVITRIEATPSDLRLSMGGGKTMTKEEMIEHVKKEDDIGKQIIRNHISFIRAVAKGEVTSALASVE